MKFFLPVFARWLHTVSLSLWLGGLIAIGAVVAPTAFHTLRGSSTLTLTQANTLAGGIVGGSLFLFNNLCYVCGAVLLLSNTLLLRHAPRRWIWGCCLVTALLLVSALLLGLWLTPALNEARHHADWAEFDRLHHLYEQISTLVQFPLLLLLAWLGVLRDASYPVGGAD